MSDNTEPITQHSLILRAQNGDREAWQDLCSIYVPVILYWVQRGLRVSSDFVARASPDDAEDIAQTTMLKVWKHLNRFQFPQMSGGKLSVDEPQSETSGSSGSAFRRWLQTIVRNTAVELHRKKQRSPDGYGGSTWAAVIEQVEEREWNDDGTTRLVIAQTLMLMQSKFRFSKVSCDLFLKKVDTGRTFADLAEEFGLSEQNARSRFRHVIRKLRELLGSVEGVFASQSVK